MKKNLTVHKIIKSCVKGDILSDGVRFWKVVDSAKEGGDCVIATPYNWNKQKMGLPFELWDDAAAKVTIIPGLQVKNFTT